ncbi:MAG TPA: YegS/Rv2252/BmrU family lipid kinase [Clostridiaceae bacterium]
MYKVKFIYNPYSGENHILSKLDTTINVFQKNNISIIPFRISNHSKLNQAFEGIDDSYKFILIAGGDGTINNVVNCMKERGIDLPIAVLPTGTANDFSQFIGMPSSIEKSLNQILELNERKVDLGKVNDKYFVNVFSAGFFTDVSQNTDTNLKNILGKSAYYVKGIEQLYNLKSVKLQIKSKEKNIVEEVYTILIFNGQTAGNFKLAYKASIEDGFLDVVILKACPIIDTVGFLFNMMKGDHLSDENSVLYFKTKSIEINCTSNTATDMDGEKGPEFPLKIQCIDNGLRVIGTKF